MKYTVKVLVTVEAQTEEDAQRKVWLVMRDQVSGKGLVSYWDVHGNPTVAGYAAPIVGGGK